MAKPQAKPGRWSDHRAVKDEKYVGTEFLERILKLRTLVELSAKYEEIFRETQVAHNDIGRHLAVLQLPSVVIELIRKGKVRPADAVFIAATTTNAEHQICLAKAFAEKPVDYEDIKVYLRNKYTHSTLDGRLAAIGLDGNRLVPLAERRKIMFGAHPTDRY